MNPILEGYVKYRDGKKSSDVSSVGVGLFYGKMVSRCVRAAFKSRDGTRDEPIPRGLTYQSGDLCLSNSLCLSASCVGSDLCPMYFITVRGLPCPTYL
ncbi:hypothetical protein ACTXT7_003971 [Hymenolepis weldensis]